MKKTFDNNRVTFDIDSRKFCLDEFNFDEIINRAGIYLKGIRYSFKMIYIFKN